MTNIVGNKISLKTMMQLQLNGGGSKVSCSDFEICLKEVSYVILIKLIRFLLAAAGIRRQLLRHIYLPLRGLRVRSDLSINFRKLTWIIAAYRPSIQ